jgi:hypothetical protein
MENQSLVFLPDAWASRRPHIICPEGTYSYEIAGIAISLDYSMLSQAYEGMDAAVQDLARKLARLQQAFLSASEVRVSCQLPPLPPGLPAPRV